MHELLAVIIFVLLRERVDVEAEAEADDGSALWHICNPAYLENDAFLLFSKARCVLAWRWAGFGRLGGRGDGDSGCR